MLLASQLSAVSKYSHLVVFNSKIYTFNQQIGSYLPENGAIMAGFLDFSRTDRFMAAILKMIKPMSQKPYVVKYDVRLSQKILSYSYPTLSFKANIL